MRYSWIDNVIIGIIELYETKSIYELYQSLSIDIIKLNKSNVILKSSEAMYQRNFFGEEIVFIRDDLEHKYEKFILAHELGHALLHTEIITAAFNKNLINKGKLEKQADYFALKLLGINIDAVSFEGYTVEQISKALYVSEKSLDMY
ncbi:ImmA/IrrE family metallo-endopeptidase [Clostridium sp. D2Q-14]|uniref:ImmA/IrrE family metallo-endopeptidase n=1 Tax=Anaeromonas gelatinilytica TaxID=2683194 RepID=UPI00193B48F9|nr:ImmA/IrrE family metallo-endopeptidase [Anaeromonas gelatinilytica]MBS4535608.1 ImmA/IrrE family metallo-endopeptidase [Anaeromonas gelatinilytica]